jgi:hypothetical protein
VGQGELGNAATSSALSGVTGVTIPALVEIEVQYGRGNKWASPDIIARAGSRKLKMARHAEQTSR